MRDLPFVSNRKRSVRSGMLSRRLDSIAACNKNNDERNLVGRETVLHGQTIVPLVVVLWLLSFHQMLHWGRSLPPNPLHAHSNPSV